MSAWVSVVGAGVIWLALLGPVIALFTHLSGSAIVSALTSPGALDPLVTSVESGLVTLGVLFVFCTPLAWMLARGRLPFPRVWETGVLCSLLLPPLVIGLLLVFLVGPYTPIGQVLAWVHLVRDQHLPRAGHRRGLRVGTVLRARCPVGLRQRRAAAGAAGGAAR